MKYIFVNLKRFDVPAEMGGVNRLSPPDKWAQAIMPEICKGLKRYLTDGDSKDRVLFTFFFPEAHIIQAVGAIGDFPVSIGCQSVHWDDITKSGNFGAFTSSRPAAAMNALGCSSVIIGHCEERRVLAAMLAEGGVESETAASAANSLLGKKITAAMARNLAVLYCVGEKAEEQEHWKEVLSAQLQALPSATHGTLVIGYEPVWAIGPGKTPPDRAYIEKVARFIKEKTNLPIVYGGGLKSDNAEMLKSIPEIDGGLIALTRFSGEIGFYPAEYLEIVDLYLS